MKSLQENDSHFQFKKLFLEPIILKAQLKDFSKYLVISLLCLTADYLTYWILSVYKIFSIPSSSALGYSLGLLISFFLFKKSIFSNGWLRNRKLYEFILFLISGAIGILATYLSTRIYVMLYGENIHVAKLSAVGLSFITVFLFRKKVVFRIST
jgi:putative flippase GtrA